MTAKSKTVFVLLACVMVWTVGLLYFSADVEGMAPPNESVSADAIVVLTGGTNRIQAGFDLLEKKRGRKMFISGVYRGNDVREIMKLRNQEKTSEFDCCIALGEAENTVGNAEETAAWLKQEGFSSFYLVTANYHMPRALLEFSARVPGMTVIPYPVLPEKLDLSAWWSDPTACGLMVREYMKYLLIRIKMLVFLP